MDDFHGLLPKDFGFKPQQDKSSVHTSKSNLNSIQDDGFSIFGGPPKYSNSNTTTPFDLMFDPKNVKSSSTVPVFDKPVYDDEVVEDIFDGIPGLKSSSSVKLDDDLLGNLGKVEPELKSNSSRGVGGNRKKWAEEDKNSSAFDDLLPGFGGSSPPKNRTTSGTSRPQQLNTTFSVIDDPFVVLETASIPAYASSGLFTESLEQIDKPSQSRSTAVNVSSTRGELFDDTDPIIRDAKSKPLFSSDMNSREKDESRLRTSPHRTHNSTGNQSAGEDFIKEPEKVTQKKAQVNSFRESQPRFDTPSVSSESQNVLQNGFRSTTGSTKINLHTGMSPKSEDNFEEADGVWLTVLEVILTTLPTSAPPPSRPPPPRPQQILKEVKGSAFYGKSEKTNEVSSHHHSTQSNWSPQTVPSSVRSSGLSSMDEFEDLTTGRPHSIADEDDNVISNGISAAFMKEAMDRAEAKLKHAKEVRQRENAARNSGGHQETNESSMKDVLKQDPGEKHESLDHKQVQKERAEKDGAQKYLEKEKEQALEIEREREKGRLAVDRAMKEVRERVAAEARQKAERAAVDKVNAGARERAGRAAVHRVQNEVHERATTEAREREEKASSEAKERKNAEDKMKADAVARAEVEARIRADRVSVNRATAEARERAAAAAAAATRENQQTSENNFNPFDMSAQPGSTSRNAAGTSSSIRKASSTTNVVDDLTSFFEANPLSGDFQEIVGESDKRRRAKLKSDQRTQERTDKALADKIERDQRTLWEQAERQRMAETLDFEIKRWSAGKEGNMRALLSTLQYVLWPECGWQPVSLTDLITAASAKSVYKKAVLCIHPDKMQQRGANLQQKYIAEKVFDLLQEALKKLNAEELF